MARFADGMRWMNPPPVAEARGGALRVVTGDRTDFWRETHYGFRRDDGHFLHLPRAGEFTATVTFDGAYEALYDQAGLMVRASEELWVKAGVELTDGARHLSVVVTQGRSDWSARPLVGEGPVTIRASRLGDALLIQVREGGSWSMLRLAPFPREVQSVMVGPYCCSPQRAGFEAAILGFDLADPQVRELH